MPPDRIFLFGIGAWLATTRGFPAMKFIEEITEERVRFLERAIDDMSEKMPALKAFIICWTPETMSIN